MPEAEACGNQFPRKTAAYLLCVSLPTYIHSVDGQNVKFIVLNVYLAPVPPPKKGYLSQLNVVR